MKLASKVLLIIEAVALAYFSLVGIYISFVGLSVSLGAREPSDFGFLNEDHFIGFLAAFILLGALISGWRIFAWVMTNGPKKGKYINPIWWGFAGLGALLTVVVLLLVFQGLLECTALVKATSFACSFQFGAFFLIPFAHLIIEFVWQRRTYKTLQPTGFVGGSI